MRAITIVAAFVLAACGAGPVAPDTKSTIRVATFNASLFSNAAGGTVRRLSDGDPKVRQIAAIIQTVRPDLLLINEFDYDLGGVAAERFQRDYLEVGQMGRRAIAYRYRYSAPVNTGVPSGLDIDQDGSLDGPADAWGYGHHHGQYGMLVLSRFPIAADRVRSFRLFRWSDMPAAQRPLKADGSPYYDDAMWGRLRLSSKSHWDVPVDTPFGELHFLVSHPTPPVFDGPEDRNGRRNHDEIRIWADYVAGDPQRVGYLYDDANKRGGLATDALFVIAGDLNADPVDGLSSTGAIAQLLDSPRVVATPAPRSDGAAEAGLTGEGNLAQRGDPALDTGQFGGKTGNMRIDYVLPGTGLKIADGSVFWPPSGDKDAELMGATDHHLVWVDLAR
jgi:endonuclease/exonuclease/phosphatase family metal-dependent hydrolase